MIDDLRKRASFLGLLFFITSAVIPFYDPGSDSVLVKDALEPFVTPMLGAYTDTAVGILALLYLSSNLIFYFLAWRNSKNTLWFLYLTYALDLMIVSINWGPEVNLGISTFIGTLACFADGVIFTCMFISSNGKKQDQFDIV